MATGAARRLAGRGGGIGEGLGAAIARLQALPWDDIATAGGMVVAWRVAVWILALFFSYLGRGTYPPEGATQFFERVLLQGESLWHIWIGDRGYAFSAEAPSTAAFPPLFALLVRLVTLIMPSRLWAGALVAHAALVAALAYLVALGRLDYDRPTALRTAAAALLVPAAPFLGAVYPESTLLLAVTAALYHARRGAWGMAGGWAMLAGLTRGAGLLLMVPLFIEWARQAKREGTWRDHVQTLAPLALAPLAFLGFLAYLGGRVGVPNAFFRAQDVLGGGSLLRPAGLATFGSSVLREVGPAAPHYPPTIVSFPAPLIPAVLDIASLIVYTMLGLWLLFRVRMSYGIFVLTGVAASFLIGGLPGTGRHLLALAPAYLALAALTRRPTTSYLAALLGIAGLSLTVFAYVNGFWAG